MSEPCRPTRRTETPDVAQAKDILRGADATREVVIDLVKRLKKRSRFGYARRLLERLRERDRADSYLRQQHALCTYKDKDLPADSRLTLALEILSDGEDLETTTDQETLGLAGAIHKRRWEVDTQRVHLERSLRYYRRGYRVGPERDRGYTGINAAFVLDLLADLEEGGESDDGRAPSPVAQARRDEATSIRRELIAKLPPLIETDESVGRDWWFCVTLAEAHFGVRRFEEATTWIQRGKEGQEIPDWELQSTALQLASIARLQEERPLPADEFEKTPAAAVLRALVGPDKVAAVRASYVGKVGLALSGGGFRASLYHIGVLAKLAELDVLRLVEVLSCVSGGSIVGAHYYLEVKRLLEATANPSREEYVDLVRRVERDFLAGVQKNIRIRVATNVLASLRMIFSRDYSRTMRAGELYEEHLYSRVADGHGQAPRWLTDLFIVPRDADGSFVPRHDNWARPAKVPDLILNATALNTGHNWQFTASWMGEPAANIDVEVDGNERLRRMYYWEAPPGHRCVRLGHAVGASACVPGIFEPLIFSGLYDDRTVALVDGGVHDNQGIVGLLEQDCTVLLVSDASGQSDSERHPSTGTVGVPLRSNTILQSRIRTEQFQNISARLRGGLLRGLMFIHLKSDLDVDPVDWTGCQDPQEASGNARPAARRGPLTRYGVHKEVQRGLAALRTDLDSFSDAEAFALMTSGYLMTEHAFAHEASLRTLRVHEGPRERWRFLELEDLMKDGWRSVELRRHLRIGSGLAFKVWRLSPPLRTVGLVLLVLLGLGLSALAWRYWPMPLVRVSTVGWAALAAVASALVGKGVMRIVQFRSALQKMAIGAGLAAVGWMLAWLHLWVFDRVFLRLGAAARVRR